MAQEVRDLALRSAQAAKETQLLIENEQVKTAYGTKTADETVKMLTDVLEKIMHVADISDQIAGASKEQADRMIQIDMGIHRYHRLYRAIRRLPIRPRHLRSSSQHKRNT